MEVNAQQAYLFEILAPICARDAGGARPLPCRPGSRRGSARCTATRCSPRRSSGSRAEGAAPFYTGDVAAAVCAHVAERGGLLTADDLAAYEAVPRAPVRVAYRGSTVVTNPPPSAGGTLLAHALRMLDAGAVATRRAAR